MVKSACHPFIVQTTQYSIIFCQMCVLKVVYIFLLACFVILKRAFVKLGKMFFIPLQKLFSFSKKSKFRIFDIKIS